MKASGVPPTLETARLILRAHRVDDFADVASMWADPAVVRHISGVPSTAETSWSRLLRYAGHWSMVGFGYWAVEARDDGRFVGEVGFADYRRDIQPSLAGRPEAGWVFKSDEHGRGLASEAVIRIHQWADTNMSFGQTVCILDPEHAASIKVARKVGYSNAHMGTYRGQPTMVMTRDREEI